MRFPGIRLVEQTEEKFRRIRDFLKEQVGAISKAQKAESF